MAAAVIDIEAFQEAARTLPVLDVRSPGEYAHAHIPGAHSLPLFTDEERKVIGTAYKQDSREAAIKIGLDAFGPKMRAMVEATEAICHKARQRKVLVHCWRGGMRSAAVAWLLDLYGFEVLLLEGGYKRYRQWVLRQWEAPRAFRVIGGYTGSGKTAVLQQLSRMSQPVLDLEDLAQHKGSVFGGLGQPGQPTQELFENRTAAALHGLSQRWPGQPVWVEDESQRIGNLNLPPLLWRQLSTSPLLFLDIPFEARLDHIVAGYRHHTTESLLNGIIRIKKRLGGLETKTAVSYLIEGDTRECFRVLLHYYDKLYRKAITHKQPQSGITGLAFDTVAPAAIAGALKDRYL